jgi:hypothetical protein
MWANRSPHERAEIAKKISVALRGRTTPADVRRKLSLAHKGQVSWNKGLKETRPEVLERLRVSHLGKTLPTAQRNKISESLKGRTVSAEVREKIRKSQPFLGKSLPLKTRRKLSVACRGWSHSAEAKRKIAASSKRRWRNPVFKATVGERIRVTKTSEEGRAKCIAAGRKIWANPAAKEKRARTISKPEIRRKFREGAEKSIKSARRKPNGLEQRVNVFLDGVAPGQWRYNGGGRGAKKIAGHFPDFVCAGQKKLIEVDGEYWHTNPAKDRERNSAYKRAGYRLLVVKSGAVYSGIADRRLKRFCYD